MIGMTSTDSGISIGLPRGDVPTRLTGRPLIVFDGTESVNGRALLTLSALYWCTKWLPEAGVRFIDVSDQDVVLACRAFEWDTGIDVEVVGPDAGRGRSPLADAWLYAGIGFRSAGHMRLAEAGERAIPVILALQFPDPEWAIPSVLLREDEAFSPRKFAAHLREAVQPWL